MKMARSSKYTQAKKRSEALRLAQIKRVEKRRRRIQKQRDFRIEARVAHVIARLKGWEPAEYSFLRAVDALDDSTQKILLRLFKTP